MTLTKTGWFPYEIPTKTFKSVFNDITLPNPQCASCQLVKKVTFLLKKSISLKNEHGDFSKPM